VVFKPINGELTWQVIYEERGGHWTSCRIAGLHKNQGSKKLKGIGRGWKEK
jgi:hypothetical protein